MIGIIGGSGFYEFLENPEIKDINTPFGKARVQLGQIGDVAVGFIARHGIGHSLPPSKINYRANIYAAHHLKMEKILASNAVGSLRVKYKPNQFAVPDQIIDFTSSRKDTFFDGSDFSVTTRKDRLLKGVVHTDVTEPYDNSVRNDLIVATKEIIGNVIETGTMVVVNGPRYESPGEIKAYGILGADFAGMTSSPEAFLAKELDIPYATLVVITNFAAGLQKTISHDEVDEAFKRKIVNVKKIFSKVILN